VTYYNADLINRSRGITSSNAKQNSAAWKTGTASEAPEFYFILTALIDGKDFYFI
jgi:hypothetical protein